MADERVFGGFGFAYYECPTCQNVFNYAGWCSGWNFMPHAPKILRGVTFGEANRREMERLAATPKGGTMTIRTTNNKPKEN